MTIAGIPVGGLDRTKAAQRLLEFFSLPIELHYGDNTIQLSPATIGYSLDFESMLAAADMVRTQKPFWNGFWDYLWGLPFTGADVPLQASFSEVRLRTYLRDEISPRYDKPAISALPAPGASSFQAGQTGTAIDEDGAVRLIERTLKSTSRQRLNLPLKRDLPPRPSRQNVEILLKRNLDTSGFDGLTGFYMLDLQTLEEIHFIYYQGNDLPVYPDLSFTAASVIKIPIMISIMRRIGETPNEEIISLLKKMIIESGNAPADWLMQQVINKDHGPLEVTADMKTLGLQDTFLAGYFAPGSPLMKKIETPGNTRTDFNTKPDPYNQTSPSEIGTLMGDLYQCAEVSGGALIAAFPDRMNQKKCQTMIDYLTLNAMPSLIKAGTPDGTKIAHKHGWVSDNFGVINVIQDASIVYTPGGNYVLAIFLYHPTQLVWDPSSKLVADLSRIVYNYYNLPKSE
jgi:beta-lactamase class A